MCISISGETLDLMRTNRAILIAVVLLVLIAMVYTWAMWRYFTIPVPGGNDFLAHYSVWDIFLERSVSPYSDEAALYTQNLIRGRPAEPGEDQNRLTYPFYSILIHGPFTLFDYPLARAIYMTLIQAAIILGVALTIRLFSWRLPFWMIGVLLPWSILHYPEARSIILGQFAPLGFLSLIGALYLLQKKRDLWAGIVLVVFTMKPTLIFLIIPFLLLWAAARKRWKFILGFFCAIVFLTTASLLVLPTWIGEWLSRIAAYSEYTVGQSPIWLLSHEYLPGLGSTGEVVITVLILLNLIFLWVWALRKKDDGSIYWIVGMTLLISNIIVPRSATTNYVMLLIPTLSLFAAIDRNIVGGRAFVLIIMGISLVGHWWLHVATVVGNQEQPILFLPIPIALSLGLIMGKSLIIKDSKIIGEPI